MDPIPAEIPDKPNDDFARVHLHVIIDAPTADIPEDVTEILNDQDLELWFYSNHEEPDIKYVSHTGNSAQVPYSEIHHVANPVLGGLLTMFAKCAHYLAQTRNTSFLSLK